jgi:GDP-mannose 6-dehydrogenase
LRAILHHSNRLDVRAPVLEAIIPSNERQVMLAYKMIERTGCKRVGVLGFSFKAGTDDLRESPMVELIEHLIGKGYHLKVYDRYVSLANLHGANRAYIEQEIPHIASLMAESVDTVLEGSDVIVVGNKSSEFEGIITRLRNDQVMIDLVRILDGYTPAKGSYQGISW